MSFCTVDSTFVIQIDLSVDRNGFFYVDRQAIMGLEIKVEEHAWTGNCLLNIGE